VSVTFVPHIERSSDTDCVWEKCVTMRVSGCKQKKYQQDWMEQYNRELCD